MEKILHQDYHVSKEKVGHANNNCKSVDEKTVLDPSPGPGYVCWARNKARQARQEHGEGKEDGEEEDLLSTTLDQTTHPH